MLSFLSWPDVTVPRWFEVSDAEDKAAGESGRPSHSTACCTSEGLKTHCVRTGRHSVHKRSLLHGFGQALGTLSSIFGKQRYSSRMQGC